jgi:hypothetical protein
VEIPIHPIASLFDQLGLNSSEEEIDDFIAKNRPLPKGLKLYRAKFWNASQADFLKQMIYEDADWAEIVDQLDARLR